MSLIIELKKISKSYSLGKNFLNVLNNINLSVVKGELISIVGASGSGKSTLMNIIGLLDRPDSGNFFLYGKEVHQYTDDDLALLRNRMIGFVFQQFFLLPRITALENVALPLLYRGIRGKAAWQQSEIILEKVGIKECMRHKPSELSGGQQQRVAIARALVGNPQILLADEPTGALDSKTGQEIMDLFLDLNRQEGMTIIIITHNQIVANQCQRIIGIQDGSLLSAMPDKER